MSFTIFLLSEFDVDRKTDQFEKACTILMKNCVGNTGLHLDLSGAQDGLGHEPADGKCGFPPTGLPSKVEMSMPP